MAYDAIVRQLEIIGEAANGIDPESRALASGIEWHKIVGLRDVAIHEYFRLDSSIIRGVIENYLPDLRIFGSLRISLRALSGSAHLLREGPVSARMLIAGRGITERRCAPILADTGGDHTRMTKPIRKDSQLRIRKVEIPILILTQELEARDLR
ncbi:hypothetical protein RERY_66250 [Rhodococcus erythropolis]|nr:hypothetical protein RERY_66250 [Rhodococcus erythropolis]